MEEIEDIHLHEMQPKGQILDDYEAEFRTLENRVEDIGTGCQAVMKKNTRTNTELSQLRSMIAEIRHHVLELLDTQDYVKNQYRRTNKMIAHHIPDHTPQNLAYRDERFESLAERRKSKSLQTAESSDEEGIPVVTVVDMDDEFSMQGLAVNGSPRIFSVVSAADEDIALEEASTVVLKDIQYEVSGVTIGTDEEFEQKEKVRELSGTTLDQPHGENDGELIAREDKELAMLEMKKLEEEEKLLLRIAQERADRERMEDEEEELSKLAAEEAELARIDAEEAELARLEEEDAELAKIEAEKAELAKIEAEEADLARMEAEEAEFLKEREEELAKQEARREELAKIEAEEAELAKMEAEEAELARIEAEEAELARIEAEEAELERIEAEEAELARMEAEEVELARLEAEEAELAKLEAEEADLARLEEEKAAEIARRKEEEESARIKQEEEKSALRPKTSVRMPGKPGKLNMNKFQVGGNNKGKAVFR